MTVDCVTLEIILIVDKVVDNTLVLCLEDAAVLSSPCNGHGDIGNKGHLVLELLLDCVVKRHNDSAADKSFSESLREGAGNVTESATGHKGQRLTSYV